MESSKGKLELIGVLTVVLSLLFVAYEIRQNTNQRLLKRSFS